MPRYSVILQFPDGGSAIVHGSKPMTACICKAKLSISLCDYPVGLPVGLDPSEQPACDVPLCADCRTHIEPDTDYCPKHA